MTVSDPIFLEVADRIGRKLCRDALWAGGECNWLGWAMTPIGHSWTVAYRAQNATMYDGTSGIALFLARLHAFTGDRVVAATARGALNRSLAAAPSVEEKYKAGFFNGLAGIAYACVEAGELLGHGELRGRGLKDLESLRGVAPDAECLDVCNGSAGAIQLLVTIARRDGLPRLLETALAHGEQLLASAVKSDEGLSWDTMPGMSDKNMLGYAHGSAGIACALLELWAATGEERFRDAALEGFRYERSNFDEGQKNWPDFRTGHPPGARQAGGHAFMHAWCHGAPGIGFSRLRAHQLLPDDEAIGRDAQLALQSTADSLSASASVGHGNFSLCHGAGGNAELLLTAGDVLARPELRQVAEAVGRNGIVQYHAADMPWSCGVNLGLETPNLMLGLAGIGHFYLRLCDSAAVPSVLLIAPREAAGEGRRTVSAS